MAVGVGMTVGAGVTGGRSATAIRSAIVITAFAARGMAGATLYDAGSSTVTNQALVLRAVHRFMVPGSQDPHFEGVPGGLSPISLALSRTQSAERLSHTLSVVSHG